MTLANVMSGLAILVSAVAAYFSWREHRRGNRLDQRLLEIEEARREERERQQETADVQVSLVRRAGNTADQIVALNRGPAKAEDVQVEIRMAGENEDAFMSPSAEDHRQHSPEPPFDLDPGTQEVWLMAFHMNFAPPLDARWSWTDQAGERHQRETTLS